MHRTHTKGTALACGVATLCFLGGMSASHAEITFDGSLGPRGQLSGQMVIPENMGTRAGANLFHSFGVFNINPGESATFTSDFSGWRRPRNVIGRVTGGTQSLIDGLLSSDIAGADIWLINPAGMLFGENAEVNVPASFHASTGDYVGFDEGSNFPANDVNSSPQLLSTAHPVAFGFLGPTGPTDPPRHGIEIQGATLRVGSGETLSLVGGDIAMAGGTVSADGGRIIVASTGTISPDSSAGEVIVDGSKLALDGFATLGDISLTKNSASNQGAEIDAGGKSGGRILIRSGQFTLDNSTIESVVDSVGKENGVIDIKSSGNVVINKGTVRANSKSDGDGAKIKISGQNIAIENKSKIVTRTDSDGQAGSITIDASADFSLLGDSKITTASIGDNASGVGTAGSAGSVIVRGSNITIDESEISTTTEGDGDAGSIKIKAANDICVNASKDCTIPGVDVTTNARSTISTSTTGRNAKDFASAGSAGSILIDAGGLLHIDGVKTTDISAFSTFVNSRTDSTGHAGSITLVADNELRIRRGTKIEVVSTGKNTGEGYASGDGGEITIAADEVKLTQSTVSVRTERDGNAGSISITGGKLLRVTNDSDVSTLSKDEDSTNDAATGNVGGILLSSNGLIEIKKGGTVRVETRNKGDTGHIEIDAPGSSPYEDNNGDFFKGLLLDNGELRAETQGQGNVAGIDIDAISVEVKNGGAIISNTQGSGNAGAINIRAEDFVKLTDFGRIQLQSTGKSTGDDQLAGNTGDLNLTVTSGVLEIIQTAKADKNDDKPDTTGIFVFSGRSTDRGKGGSTGDINIDVTSGQDPTMPDTEPSIKLSSGQISSRTYSRSNGGNVSIRTDGDVLVETGTNNSGNTIAASQIQVQSLMRATDEQGSDDSGGNAGNILIDARSVKIAGGGTLTSITQGSGNGGDIAITADKFEMNGGVINASGQLPNPGVSGQSVSGKGGDITLGIAGSILIQDDSNSGGRGNVRSIANAEGNAGNIIMTAKNVTLGNHSKIEATAKDAGDAGDITIIASDSITVSGNAVVTTDTTAERKRIGSRDGDGGSIILTAGNQVEITDSSKIASVTKGDGKAGDIAIEARNEIRITDTAEIKVDSLGLQATSNATAGRGGNLSLLVTDGNLHIEGSASSQDNRVNITADSGSSKDCNCSVGKAGNIDISVRGDGNQTGNIFVKNAAITSNAWGENEGGTIEIYADSKVDLAQQARVEVTTRKSGVEEEDDNRGKGGNAGNISVVGDDIRITGRSRLRSITNGSGNGGSINVTAGSLTIDDGVINASGQIPARDELFGQRVDGDAGDITISVSGTMIVRKDTNNTGTIRSIANAEGDGGTISVTAGSLDLENGADITTSAQADGDAGSIVIEVRDKTTITGNSKIVADTSGLRATDVGTAGEGGNIILSTDRLEVSGNGQISSNTSGEGAAGRIEITALDGIHLADGGKISVATNGTATYADQEKFPGNVPIESPGDGGELIVTSINGDLTIDGFDDAGNDVSTGLFATSGKAIYSDDVLVRVASGGVAGSIDASAKSVSINGDGRINSDSVGAGAGGDINITASLGTTITDRGTISSSTSGSGQAGSVELHTGQLLMSGNSGIRADTAASGTGGSLRLTVSEMIALSDEAEVSSNTTSRGDAGTLKIESRQMELSGNSRVSTDSSGLGSGGNAVVTATDSMVLTDNAVISSNAASTGDAGTLEIATARLEMLDNSLIRTDTRGTGNGGSLTLDVIDTISMTDASSITSNASSSGNAGSLTINSGVISIDASAYVPARNIIGDVTNSPAGIRSDTSGAGNGGSVSLNATESIILSNDAVVSSNTSGAGNGGIVSLVAEERVVINNDAIVTSRATQGSSGAAGSITIETGQFLIDSARIDVEGEGSGAGGSIEIKADDVNMRNRAVVSAASLGTADSGSVTIDVTRSVTMQSSTISTESRNAEGGNIRVTAGENIFLDDSEITAKANGSGGNLEIGDDPEIGENGNEDLPGGVPDFVVLRNSKLIADAQDGDGGNITITTNAFVSDINSEITASSERGLDGEVRIEAPNNITGSIIQLETPDFDISALLASTCGATGDDEASRFAVRNSVVPPLPDDYRPSAMQWLTHTANQAPVDVDRRLLASASEIPCNY